MNIKVLAWKKCFFIEFYEIIPVKTFGAKTKAIQMAKKKSVAKAGVGTPRRVGRPTRNGDLNEFFSPNKHSSNIIIIIFTFVRGFYHSILILLF